MPNPADTKLVACVRHKFTHWRFPAGLADEIKKRYPEMNVVHLPDYTRLAEEIEDADIFVGWSLRPEQSALARKLKWIHATAAGIEQLMRDDIRQSDVVITNSSGVMTVPMAEHTLGLILALGPAPCATSSNNTGRSRTFGRKSPGRWRFTGAV
jgi:phosphoglycerate dehydrogenase-like enzyme